MMRRRKDTSHDKHRLKKKKKNRTDVQKKRKNPQETSSSSIPQCSAILMQHPEKNDLPGMYDRFSTLPNLWASPTGPTEAGLP